MNRRELMQAVLLGTAAGNLAAQEARGMELWVHPARGDDRAAGTKAAPLKTLAEAARRVNQSDGPGPVTVYLSEGIYSIGETTLLRPERRRLSKDARLTIRAEILPDDPEWDTGRMPTLIHTMPLPEEWHGRRDPAGGAANGMLAETNHVTIRGLKFLGYPLVETPKPGQIWRLYAVSRLAEGLEDLEISRCMFLGDDHTNPMHVAAIVKGDGARVHHCVFRGSKITVVYWTGGSHGHSFTHNCCDAIYGSAVWTCGIRNDFDFRYNVVSGCNYVWTWQPASWARAVQQGQPVPDTIRTEEMISYRVSNCHFAGNRRLFGSGVGARQRYADLDPSWLKLEPTQITAEPVPVEKDQTRRNYLHPAEGSEAARIGAGLFLSRG
ncbi:MAG: hypothetical protein N2036_12590 [Bryobacteraceae bacterium]|nr:hypothetical protein [Bryobacteraceae bacterium]